MANPQQLDIVKPNEIEETIHNLIAKGILGGAPVPVPGMAVDSGVLEHAADGASSSVEGFSSQALSHGGTVIPGPSEGGSLMDRPVGSFLAEQAQDQSLSLEEYAGDLADAPTYLAKRLAGAGEMTIAGADVNLINFVPGGDIVQMIAGERFDPSSMALALAKGKMEAEVVHGHLLHRETDHEQELREAERSSSPAINDDAGNAVTGEQARSHGETWGTEKKDGLEADEPMQASSDDGQTPEDPVTGKPRSIDNDTAARDMAILSGEHARNLDNAVSQWDEHDVHTEMMLHGRKIEIDTHFDAYNPDNQKERDMAVEHVKDIPEAENKETVTQGNRMAFRSQVHAHLEAAARDEGISR